MTSAQIVTTDLAVAGKTIMTSEIVSEFVATDTYRAHAETIGAGADVNLAVKDIVFVQN